jgi:hypothetical protein
VRVSGAHGDDPERHRPGGERWRGTLTAANALGWDLAQACERLTRDTRAAFPSPAQRWAPDDPAYWLTETCGEVHSIGRLTGKVQK